MDLPIYMIGYVKIQSPFVFEEDKHISFEHNLLGHVKYWLKNRLLNILTCKILTKEHLNFQVSKTYIKSRDKKEKRDIAR